MATLTLGKADVARTIADRAADAEKTLVEDARALKAKATEAFEEGAVVARRAYGRAVRDLEDYKDEAVLKVRKAPLAAVGVTFGAGLLLGLILGWMSRRPQQG